MVAEADESDRSFLMLWPSIAVVTNIDDEHMESYGSFGCASGCVCRVREQGSVLRRHGRVRRRCRTSRDLSASDAPPGDVRPRSAPDAHVLATDVELGPFGGRCVVASPRGGRHRDARPNRAGRARPAQPAERSGCRGRRRAHRSRLRSQVADGARELSRRGAALRALRRGRAACSSSTTTAITRPRSRP